MGSVFLNFLPPPHPILLFFFLSVFPLDYVEALGNLRDSRGFLVLPFFFLITNKERIRRHGPESVFMVVCDKVVRAKWMSAFSSNALSPGFATWNLKWTWTTTQHTRAPIRGNASFHSPSVLGGHSWVRGGGEPSFSNKLVTVQDIENHFFWQALENK